jgi:hypothetical protein
MNTPDQRYRQLLSQLLFEREAAGGELLEDEEFMFVERLDQLWRQLSTDEQDSIDRELAEPIHLLVNEEPHLVDCVVSEGSSVAPRKAV